MNARKCIAAFVLGAVSVSANAQSSADQRRALISPLPDYPERAYRERLEGEVQVCYTVDINGRVHRPRVASTTHRWFNRAAIKAARSMRYEPAEPGAANAKTNLCSKFRFKLNRLSETGG